MNIRDIKVFKWFSYQLLASGISIVTFLWIEENAGYLEFVPSLILLLSAALVIVWLQSRLRSGKFFLEMPAFMTVYILFALFIPTLWLYNQDTLKALLEWNDERILLSCGYGLLFLQALWISYDMGKMIFPQIKATIVQKRIPLRGIHFMMGLSLIASVLAIFTGTFGVLQNKDFEATASYSQYIDVLQQLGILGLILLTYQYPQKTWTIAGYTTVLFLIGIVSATKQAALMPCLAVGLTHYYRTKRISWKWVVIGAMAVFLAFAIVAMIRQFYFDRYQDGVNSVAEVAHISRNALNMDEFDKAYEVYDVGDQIVMRIFYGNAIAKAIQYSDQKGYGVPQENALFHVFLSPFYAVVPRIIYPDKPTSRFGNWFASEVYIRQKVDYAIGITPVGYGYMIAGSFGVVLVGITLGVFMSLMYNVLFQKYFVIYVFCILRMSLPPDVTWEYVTGCIRIAIVAWIILKIVSIKGLWKQDSMEMTPAIS
jgi:hypothetical protein